VLEALQAAVRRLNGQPGKGAMLKSMREAKRHTTWAAPNTAYEEGMLGFVREALDPTRSAAFLDAFLPFQERIARLGFRNSLVQTALKLTLPGMPDIYQGTELWDLSLVDPDNRRPVDYGQRTRLLEEVSAALARDRAGTAAAMLEGWHDGRLKLALTATLLAHRREHPALYAEGAYEPVAASGPKADHLCAFARGHGEDALLVVAARFPARLEAEPAGGTRSSLGRKRPPARRAGAICCPAGSWSAAAGPSLPVRWSGSSRSRRWCGTAGGGGDRAPVRGVSRNARSRVERPMPPHCRTPRPTGPVTARGQHLPGESGVVVREERAAGKRKYHLANHPVRALLRAQAAVIKAR
jgi:hypothetical protein